MEETPAARLRRAFAAHGRNTIAVLIGITFVILCIHSSRPYVLEVLRRHFGPRAQRLIPIIHKHLWLPLMLECAVFPGEDQVPQLLKEAGFLGALAWSLPFVGLLIDFGRRL